MACAGGDGDAHFGAVLGVEGGLEVEIGGGTLQGFFRPGLGFLGALQVNFFGALGGVGQDGHLVRQHLGESPRDRKVVGIVL